MFFTFSHIITTVPRWSISCADDICFFGCKHALGIPSNRSDGTPASPTENTSPSSDLLSSLLLLHITTQDDPSYLTPTPSDDTEYDDKDVLVLLSPHATVTLDPRLRYTNYTTDVITRLSRSVPTLATALTTILVQTFTVSCQRNMGGPGFKHSPPSTENKPSMMHRTLKLLSHPSAMAVFSTSESAFQLGTSLVTCASLLDSNANPSIRRTFHVFVAHLCSPNTLQPPILASVSDGVITKFGSSMRLWHSNVVSLLMRLLLVELMSGQGSCPHVQAVVEVLITRLKANVVNDSDQCCGPDAIQSAAFLFHHLPADVRGHVMEMLVEGIVAGVNALVSSPTAGFNRFNSFH